MSVSQLMLEETCLTSYSLSFQFSFKVLRLSESGFLPDNCDCQKYKCSFSILNNLSRDKLIHFSI